MIHFLSKDGVGKRSISSSVLCCELLHFLSEDGVGIGTRAFRFFTCLLLLLLMLSFDTFNTLLLESILLRDGSIRYRGGRGGGDRCTLEIRIATKGTTASLLLEEVKRLLALTQLTLAFLERLFSFADVECAFHDLDKHAIGAFRLVFRLLLHLGGCGFNLARLYDIASGGRQRVFDRLLPWLVVTLRQQTHRLSARACVRVCARKPIFYLRPAHS